LGTQKLYIEPNFSRVCKFRDSSHFFAVEPAIYETIEVIKLQYPNEEVKVMLTGNPNKRNPTWEDLPGIKIVGTQPQEVDGVMNLLEQVRAPRLYHLKNDYFYRKMKDHAAQSVVIGLQHKYHCKIELDTRQRLLKIYSVPEDKGNIENEITKYLENQSYDQVAISFRGKCIKALMVNGYIKLVQIRNMFPEGGVNIVVSLVKKEIYVGAYKSVIKKVQQEIEKYIIENKETIDSPEKTCTVCWQDFVEVDETYRLQLCGHKFCLLCLSHLIRETSSDIETLPILCPNVDCKEPIGLRDIRDIAQPDTLKKIFSLSYNKFLEQNGNIYGQCRTANCKQIYLKDKFEKFECSHCLNIYCKKCENVYHEGMTCEEKKQEMDAEKEINSVIDNKRIKRCLKCKNAVEKTEGCNHMACRCGAHFCWLCLACFDNEQLCTQHLRVIHKDSLFVDMDNLHNLHNDEFIPVLHH